MPFPPTALRCRHGQTIRDSSSSYKIKYVIAIKKFLNPKGHQTPISGLKVTAILLKGLIWPIGGVASGRDCVCSLRSRLVLLLGSCSPCVFPTHLIGIYNSVQMFEPFRRQVKCSHKNGQFSKANLFQVSTIFELNVFD